MLQKTVSLLPAHNHLVHAHSHAQLVKKVPFSVNPYVYTEKGAPEI
jgi:hypothetical protein